MSTLKLQFETSAHLFRTCHVEEQTRYPTDIRCHGRSDEVPAPQPSTAVKTLRFYLSLRRTAHRNRVVNHYKRRITVKNSLGKKIPYIAFR